MSDRDAPALEALQDAPQPAWLWDGMRRRIVWANRAGIGFFGGDTLFDVLDRRFNADEPGVARVAELTRTLKSDAPVEAFLAFPSAEANDAVACRCFAQRLADGRPGVLVVAEPTSGAGKAPGAALAAALAVLPVGIVLFGEDGAIGYANEAAVELLPAERRRSLEGLFGGADAANRFTTRLAGAGSLSEIVRLASRFGPRDVRVHARGLPAGEDCPRQAMLVLEDVTERRALERNLRDEARRLADFVASAAEFTFEIDPELRFRNLAPEFETLTGIARTRIEGAAWPDIAARYALDPTQAIARALDARRPWRAVIDWRTPLGALPLSLSAVVMPGPDGGFAGYRGIAARAVLVAAAQDAWAEAEPQALATYAGPRPMADFGAASPPDPSADEAAAAAAAAAAASPPPPAGDAPPTAIAERRALTDEDHAAFRALGETLKHGAVRAADGPEPIAPAQAVRAVLDGLPQAALVHRDGQILHANPAAAWLLGFDSAAELAAEGSLDRVLPDWSSDKSAVTLANGEREVRAAVSEASIPWDDGAARRLLIVPEAPARRSADWSQGSAELRAILDTTSDGIITLDQAGRIRTLNAGAAAIFGYEAKELTGQPLADLLDPDSRRILKDYLAALSGSGIAAIFNDGREVTAIERKGGEIPLFLTIGRMHDPANGRGGRVPAGSRQRFCAVVRDITQWKKTEAELRAAKEAAERTSALKSEFLANISHELRTPLNAILGFSDVMRGERFGALRNEKYKGYANDIHASGQHLLSLINDLLDLSKVEAGKLELNFTSVHLPGLIEQSIGLMQNQATDARVILRTSLPRDLPNVVADQRSMKQILLNLLSNAVKFTEPGGQVIVSAGLEASGEVKIRVKDTGIGMSEDDLKLALEPFRRVEIKGRSEAAGTGLGLPLTKALTEANRAAFSISSEPRKGTLVEITFPTTRVLAE